ncbi:tetratricopeptide repeat protein [Candidatus Chloroploca sp. M-50]|uniref:Tetratricopeptide repeat protein n=1 Tax=Candidatus Chloroploca mongolica TaxID=2528176 RepID=A0ABS4D9S0_9CHLR|nr:tetratricopeptide repeat protein [Candidatus Chloroploca mongolica]MBP1466187.1 tetratricopeptide repeat protein [Candidatus Chloroploca mongolica]
MMAGFFADLLANALGELLADLFGETLNQRAERRALQRALVAAVSSAEQQFASTYAEHDPELVQALLYQTRFSDLPSVRAALRDLLARPFHDPHGAVDVLRRSFTDVLPERFDRTRVDAMMAAFLAALGREVLYIPQLRELYALSFQKISAESSRATAEHTAATAHQLAVLNDGFRELQEGLRLIAARPDPHLLSTSRPLLPERQRPWHNLPQRTYPEFIGRLDELEQLARLMLPHPRSRHFVITIDGIGGVGKSALALELAYGYRKHYHSIPEEERFAAIVWVSAKRTLLTASGIQQRRQSFNTLDDLFREVATVLEQPSIVQAPLHERRSLVEHALAAQRTLLIVDNLETVDDDELLSFLRELPDPTKALLTTRHRIDIAYALRLTGMPRADALKLMQVEGAAKGVQLTAPAMDDLERRTGGVPLAIQWSIGLMSMGLSVEAVLRRLGQGQSDIARFCFAESVERIRGRDAHRLLLALALFERSVSRTMLGDVAGLANDPVGRDEGLAELLRLSLVNQKGDRFSLLPLTHAFAREELATIPYLEQELREGWITFLLSISRPYAELHHLQPSAAQLILDGQHLENLARWAEQVERIDLVLALFPALMVYLDVVGRWGDILRLADQMIDYTQLLGDERLLPLILCGKSWIESQQGQHEAARRSIEQALDVSARRGEVVWQVESLGRYVQIVRREGDLTRAEELLSEAVQLIERLPEDVAAHTRSDLMFERGKIARDRGDYQLARQIFTEAQRIFPLDDELSPFNPERAWGIAGNLGFVLHQLGELDEAAQLYERSLAYFRQFGGRGYLATLLVRLADLELQCDQLRQAEAHAREALDVGRQLGLVQEQQQAEAILHVLERTS